MARPKKKPDHPSKFGPRQPQAVNLRGSNAWKEWLEELAKANRQSISGVIDTALATFARQIGFREPPQR